MRKILASTAVGLTLAGGALALGALGPTVAGAQDQTPSAPSAPAGADGTARHGELRHKLAKAVVKDAADTIGIPAKDLVAAMKGGQSIAEVATAHGVDPQAVIDDLVADATAKIDQAVADGKLTAERGETMKGKLPERVTTIVNRHFDGSHRAAR